MKSEMYFRKADGSPCSLSGIVKDISLFIKERPDASYKIIVGSDSLGTLQDHSDFVTAVVVQRIGNGGKYFWRRAPHQKVFGLRDRIIKEVLLSLQTAQDITALFLGIGGSVDVEVHVDVGEGGKTSPLIQEVVGMIKGYQFQYKTKPESYAASSVADRHI